MRYPDIDGLSQQAENIIRHYHAPHKRYVPGTELYMFPQIWPNTGGGTAKPGYMYGQAFTSQYTCVFVNRQDNAAVVCFDNEIGYFVPALTENFKYDLGRQHMRGVTEALKLYKAVDLSHGTV